MRIGILTGGGDVPGLNPCIKAVVTRAQEFGWEALGFRRGWAGPLHVDPQDAASLREHTIVLDANTVHGIDRTGGTILHTSRTNPGKVLAQDLPAALKANIRDVIPGGMVILNSDAFTTKNIQRAGYEDDPIEPLRDRYKVVEIPVTTLNREAIKDLGRDFVCIDFSGGTLGYCFGQHLRRITRMRQCVFTQQP